MKPAPRPPSSETQQPPHSVAEELCAKAFRLAVIAMGGAILALLIALVAVAPHAAHGVAEVITAVSVAK